MHLLMSVSSAFIGDDTLCDETNMTHGMRGRKIGIDFFDKIAFPVIYLIQIVRQIWCMLCTILSIESDVSTW